MRGVDAVGGTEAEDQGFGEGLLRSEVLPGVDGEAAVFEELDVAGDGLDVGVAGVAEEAGGAGAAGQVLATMPVDLVVALAGAGARVIRDLVVLEAVRARALGDRPVVGDDEFLRR